jgi:hypothetical protein
VEDFELSASSLVAAIGRAKLFGVHLLFVGGFLIGICFLLKSCIYDSVIPAKAGIQFVLNTVTCKLQMHPFSALKFELLNLSSRKRGF